MDKKEILELQIYKSQIGKYLTKKDIVSNFPHNFEIKEGIEYEYATTSGTTSDRMEIIRKPNWWKDEYKRTYSNEKKLKKYLDENLHKIIFTTAQCSNLVCFLEKPSKEKRTIGNTLYVNNTFNPWDWTKEDVQEMIKEINDFKPYYLDADPVYLAIFLYLKEKYEIKAKIFTPTIITLSYEFVTRNLKEYIRIYFKTDVRNLYGTTEFGYAFLEDANGKMHICKDLLEISLLPINDDKNNNTYSIIVDSYKNEYMPLLKYKVGDLVQATIDEYKNFDKDGVVSKMAGREKDLIDNKISFLMLDDIISDISSKILFYQFFFIDEKTCIFKYITFDNSELSKSEEENISKKLEDIGLNISITFNKVEEILPEMSGKFSILKKGV